MHDKYIIDSYADNHDLYVSDFATFYMGIHVYMYQYMYWDRQN